MDEIDILLAMDKAIAEARYRAYSLYEINALLGERLEEKLREASKSIEARRKAISRLHARGSEGEKRHA